MGMSWILQLQGLGSPVNSVTLNGKATISGSLNPGEAPGVFHMGNSSETPFDEAIRYDILNITVFLISLGPSGKRLHFATLKMAHRNS